MSSEEGEISQCLKAWMFLNSTDVSAVEVVRALVLGSSIPIPMDLHCPASVFQDTQEGQGRGRTFNAFASFS